METSILHTKNGLDLPCVVFPIEGAEKLVYCQSRLVKTDSNLNEIAILVEWCIIPELEEMLYELHSSNI